ncbi:MAG: heme-copper oxidase subunit III [Acidobacteria bacterium]|nr:heme-copper oxidase subunit III [Acidobacteriota bacterium]
MPAVKAPGPPKISAPDSGGRGTGHKLPTGGGGEGEFSNRPPEGRGPRERLSRARFGLAVLLTTSFGLFATISLGYMWRRGQLIFDRASQSYVSVWHPIAVPNLLWWNTLLLVLSSVTLELARRTYFREELLMDEWLGLSRPTLRRAVPWEMASFVLASGFVAGQLFAWGQLRAQGIYLGSGASSQFYYFLTGLHGIHLLGGMLVLIWTVIAALIGSSLESRRIAVDITTWYWHAITVVWFGVFALLKLCA